MRDCPSCQTGRSGTPVPKWYCASFSPPRSWASIGRFRPRPWVQDVPLLAVIAPGTQCPTSYRLAGAESWPGRYGPGTTWTIMPRANVTEKCPGHACRAARAATDNSALAMATGTELPCSDRLGASRQGRSRCGAGRRVRPLRALFRRSFGPLSALFRPCYRTGGVKPSPFVPPETPKNSGVF
jgi:hypothetical protein